VLAFILSTVIAWKEPLPTCGKAEAVCGPWTMTQDDVVVSLELGLPAALVPTLYLLTQALFKLSCITVAMLLFIRRSADWMALLLSLMLVMFSLEGVQNLGVFMPIVTSLYALVSALFYLLPFIFPDGRFTPRWTVWVAPPLILLAVAAQTLPQLGFAVSDQVYSASLLITFVLWFPIAAYSAIYRYRRVSNPTERQQTKWVVAGILGTFIIIIPLAIVSIWFPPAQPSPQRMAFMLLIYLPIYIVSYLSVPAGITFAILRYRLWDIDFLIRKTLAYAILTSLLLLIFLGGIAVMQWLVGSVSSVEQSPLALVISTLISVALFNPLRIKIQNWIDRRFYRRKYNAEKVLSNFAVTARSLTDLEGLTFELEKSVQEAMQPDKVGLWLQKKG
jgi:hypothetical protein